MKKAGKKFEEDFQKSAEKAMFIYRLRDPGSSFNIACGDCPKQITRFSGKNICDFIAYSNGTLYLLELKSHKGKSIPFSAIVTSEKDKRLEKMADAEKREGVKSYVIFNWRDCGNKTFAMPASLVLDYINNSDRKSIPYFITENSQEISNRLIRVRYAYDMEYFCRRLAA